MTRLAPVALALLGACTGPGLVHGQYVGLIDAVSQTTSDRFDVVNLGPISNPNATSCAGASKVVGACCVFPPIGPIADPPYTNPDSAPAEPSAGTITLVDKTSSASGGAYSYDGQFYDALPVEYDANLWNPGDVLTVTATGGDSFAPGGYLEPFAISAPVLAPPALDLSPLAAGQTLTITWPPDSNATTMMISLGATNGGSVGCTVPDAQGTLTIDATLLAAFRSGDQVQLVGDRDTATSTTTPSGMIVFDSDGWTSIETSFQ